MKYSSVVEHAALQHVTFIVNDKNNNNNLDDVDDDDKQLTPCQGIFFACSVLL